MNILIVLISLIDRTKDRYTRDILFSYDKRAAPVSRLINETLSFINRGNETRRVCHILFVVNIILHFCEYGEKSCDGNLYTYIDVRMDQRLHFLAAIFHRRKWIYSTRILKIQPFSKFEYFDKQYQDVRLKNNTIL